MVLGKEPNLLKKQLFVLHDKLIDVCDDAVVVAYSLLSFLLVSFLSPLTATGPRLSRHHADRVVVALVDHVRYATVLQLPWVRTKTANNRRRVHVSCVVLVSSTTFYRGDYAPPAHT